MCEYMTNSHVFNRTFGLVFQFNFRLSIYLFFNTEDSLCLRRLGEVLIHNIAELAHHKVYMLLKLAISFREDIMTLLRQQVRP